MGSQLLAGALKRGRTRFEVMTLTLDPQDAARDWGAHKVDVAVVSTDLHSTGHTEFQALQKLRESHPHTPVIMLSPSRNREFVINAFRRGVRGVFYRNQPYKALSKCIRMVHRGQIWASNEDLEYIFDALTHFKPVQLANFEGQPRLTRREEEVVKLVAEGAMNIEIARSLRISEHSVRNYLSAIFKKLGVGSRVELVLCVLAQRRPE